MTNPDYKYYKYFDSYIVNTLKKMKYYLDTNTSVFFPQMIINTDISLFFMYGDYLKHPIVKIEYLNISDFHIRHNTFDNDGYTTKIVDYRYSINNNKDTVLVDSTVFEIFYEE